ncbi:MAG: hypothetical protein KJ606_12435, partial [Chloroflexi bacterium]|nr:hypothetical protein [Chloroflexota bacterium]
QTLTAEAIAIMLADLNNRLPGFGVRVTDFQITGYELDPDIKRQRLLFWESKWRGYIAKTSGEAKADQIRVREKARAEAQRDLILAIAEGLDKMDPVHLPDSLLLSLSGILDQSLQDPLSRAFIAKDLLPTLERLQELLKKR